ncbi:hypothetical protein Y032_0154g3011 [Ancylostoma ceylanicum]|uniref:Uncharacterized protein n=1 Tax=Ancylostoma ceylanicum TaxID=53326 RepID=A0A016T0H5_9BILA|nr:hypothetical protein Y032_0154g3011 [Ancylostoma ceylanicum]
MFYTRHFSSTKRRNARDARLKECLYFGATRPSRPRNLFECDGFRVDACISNGRDVVVGVSTRRREYPFRPVRTFSFKNDAMGRMLDAPASRRDAMISSMSEPGVVRCFFDFLAALA